TGEGEGDAAGSAGAGVGVVAAAAGGDGEGALATAGDGEGALAAAGGAASVWRGPLRRRSTRGPLLPLVANSAFTSKARPPWPSSGLKRHVRRAWMTDSAHGDSPLLMRASATCPSGSSVTSAMTVAVSGPAPAGKAGTTPCRS